jgi:MFS superfamily sulfate permease-like transporter
MSSDLVPGLTAVRTYKLRWFPKDLVAGLILTTLLVPQGMAYAELAGLPPITGLYTSILCLASYAVFGPSKILVLGPDSSLGPMIAATILPLVGANGDPGRAVALASALALLTGGITVLAGVGGLGFVADLVSRPTMIGYLNGLALTIMVGQLPKLFGFSVEADGFIGEVVGFVGGVLDGRTIPAALLVGGLGLIVIIGLQHWIPRIPGVLVVVVLSIIAAGSLGLADRGCRWWASCRRASHRSPCPSSGSRTSRPCWWARRASCWSRSPTRSRPPPRSRPERAPSSTAAGR